MMNVKNSPEYNTTPHLSSGILHPPTKAPKMTPSTEKRMTPKKNQQKKPKTNFNFGRRDNEGEDSR